MENIQNKDLLHGLRLNNPGDKHVLMVLEEFHTALDQNLLFTYGENCVQIL